MRLNISTNSEWLLAGLKELSKSYTKNYTNVMPENNYVLMVDNGEGELTLYANLFAPAKTVSLTRKTGHPGMAFAPYIPLVEYLEFMGDTKIELDYNDKALVLADKFNLASFHVHGMVDSDAIRWLNHPNYATHTMLMTVDAQQFKTVVGEVNKFYSKEDNRPILEGVLFTVKEGKLTVVGANGYALSKGEMDLISYASDISDFVIHGDIVASVLKRIDKSTDTLTISANDVIHAFKIGNTEILATPIEGTYPDIDRIIPKKENAHYSAWVYGSDFGRMILGATVMAKESGTGLKIHTRPSSDGHGIGTISIMSQSSEMGDSNMMIDCSFYSEAQSPQEGKYSFNHTYLKQAIYPAPKKPGKPSKSGKRKPLDSYENKLYFYGHGDPFMIDNGIVQVIIMPMQVGE